MNPPSLQLSGKKKPELYSKSQQTEAETVQDLQQQDMDIDLASEIVLPMDNETMTNIVQQSEQTKEVQKQYISQKQRAALEKARAIKSEKAKRRREGQDLANAPAIQPDVVEKITEQLHAKFEKFEQSLKDLQTKYATDSNSEALRNQQQVPGPSKAGEQLNNQVLDTTSRVLKPEYTDSTSKTGYVDSDVLDESLQYYSSMNRRHPIRDMILEDQPFMKRNKTSHEQKVFLF